MQIDRRWRMAGISASLLLNVFLVGIVVGHLIVTHRHDIAQGRKGVVPAAHVHALPSEERQKFVAVMKAHHAAIRAARMAHRQTRNALEAAIAAPTFDREAVTAGFAALRRANLDVQEAVNVALIEALQTLSPQSRASLVEHDGGRRR